MALKKSDKYRRTIWQCNRKFRDGTQCKTPHLSEEQLKQLFVKAFNHLYSERTKVTVDSNEITDIIADTTALKKKGAALSAKCDVVLTWIQNCVDENSHAVQDQKQYQQRYNTLCAEYEDTKSQLSDIHDKILTCNAKRENMKQFFSSLNHSDGPIADFDELLWYATVETVTVNEKNAAFMFKDGTVVEVNI